MTNIFALIISIIGLEITVISMIVGFVWGWFKLNSNMKKTLESIDKLSVIMVKSIEDLKIQESKQIDQVSTLASDLRVQNVSLQYMKELFEDNKRISISTAGAINNLAAAIGKMQPVLDRILDGIT